MKMNYKKALQGVKILVGLLVLTIFTTNFAYSQKEKPHDFDLIKTGQTVPSFVVKTINGEIFKIENYRGKTVLINFFADWCHPCVKELPELEDRIWKKFKDKEFVVLVIGRGHSKRGVKSFQKKHGYTFPMAPDKDKSIYEKFFTRYIPRNILINKEGKIIYHEHGYNEEEFEKLIRLIEEEVK